MEPMKIEADPLFEMAINFLENGGDLPDGVFKDAKSRFIFEVGIFRHIHLTARSAMTLSQMNEKDIGVLRERIDSRTGWFAGIVAIATGVFIITHALGWI